VTGIALHPVVFSLEGKLRQVVVEGHEMPARHGVASFATPLADQNVDLAGVGIEVTVQATRGVEDEPQGLDHLGAQPSHDLIGDCSKVTYRGGLVAFQAGDGKMGSGQWVIALSVKVEGESRG
jgi:hypothetical protein